METAPDHDTPSPLPVPSPLQSSKGSPIPANFYNSKGLSVIVSGFVFIAAIVKAKPEDIPKIVEMIVESRNVGVLGWFLAIGILLVAVSALKWMQSIYGKEIERLTLERNQLQEKLLNLGGSTR